MSGPGVAGRRRSRNGCVPRPPRPARANGCSPIIATTPTGHDDATRRFQAHDIGVEDDDIVEAGSWSAGFSPSAGVMGRGDAITSRVRDTRHRAARGAAPRAHRWRCRGPAARRRTPCPGGRTGRTGLAQVPQRAAGLDAHPAQRGIGRLHARPRLGRHGPRRSPTRRAPGSRSTPRRRPARQGRAGCTAPAAGEDVAVGQVAGRDSRCRPEARKRWPRLEPGRATPRPSTTVRLTSWPWTRDAPPGRGREPRVAPALADHLDVGVGGRPNRSAPGSGRRGARRGPAHRLAVTPRFSSRRRRAARPGWCRGCRGWVSWIVSFVRRDLSVSVVRTTSSSISSMR